MKTRNLLVAGMVALAATLVVSGAVGGAVGGIAVAPGDAPVATHSQHPPIAQGSTPGDAPVAAHPQHQTNEQNDAGADAPAAAHPQHLEHPENSQSDAPADATPGAAAGPAPAGEPGQEIWVEPLPDISAEEGARPESGEPQNSKPQSLREALAQPHGVAAAGVTPEGEGVNDGTTKQASGLTLRSLARGEQDAGVNDAARTGGCAPGYGDGRSCLPVAPPSAAQHAGHHVEVVWTCDELLTLFPQGIPLQIPGVDPLGLDKDGNGIACA